VLSAYQTNLGEATGSDNALAYAVKEAAFSLYVVKQYGDWDEAEQRDYDRERFAPPDFRIMTVDGDMVRIYVETNINAQGRSHAFYHERTAGGVSHRKRDRS